MRDARERSGTHHVTYELALDDGQMLRTGISHPVGRQTYGRRLWGHILRDQLHVDETAFWACVRDGVPPDRGAATPPSTSLPADLVALLISRVGLSEQDVSVMTRDDAIVRVERYWSKGR